MADYDGGFSRGRGGGGTTITSQAQLETAVGEAMASNAELVAALIPYLQSTDLDTEGKLEAITGVTLTSTAELGAAIAAFLTTADLNSEGKLEAIIGVTVTTAAELANAVSVHAALTTTHGTTGVIEDTANKGAAGGYASLDGTGQLAEGVLHDKIDTTGLSGYLKTSAGGVAAVALGNAALRSEGFFATAAQGATADTAVQAPAAPFNTDQGTIILDGGVAKQGISDDCTANPIVTAWTQQVGSGYTITADGSKYTWAHTHGAAAAPELQLSIPTRPVACWCHVTQLGSANDTYFAMYVAPVGLAKYVGVLQERTGGAWKLTITENGDTTTLSNATIDDSFWIGMIYDPISGVVKAFYSGNAAGSNPGLPGATGWAVHTTAKTVAVADMNINPSVIFKCLNATGSGTVTCETRGLYLANL